jgi:hypothetical protein
MPPVGFGFPGTLARAVRFAAGSKRKEVYVGIPAVQAILGDKLASSLLDRYLAKVGISGQQADEPVSPDRQDNLFEPVAGDHGAHGRFDAQSRRFSPQLWATMNRNALAAAGAALGIGALLLTQRRRPDRNQKIEKGERA